jgi:membrane protein YqaA with SNARE-associated domain
MDFLFTAEAGLAGLFLASFLAATLLPGGSEAVLAAVLLAHPEQAIAALALATLGNTLGGMSTYALGRLLPERVMRSGIHADGADETPAQQGGRAKDALVKPLRSKAVEQSTLSSPLRILAAADGDTAIRQFETLRRHGAPALLLAWAPIIGDALCAAAGWLRLPWLPCLLWMALGKGARYLVVASGVGML